jgi:uncharacterized protein (TIGR02231 family)
MKRFIIIAGFLCSVLTSLAANEPKKIHPTIKEVTVFLNRAQVMGYAQTSIEPGSTDIMLDHLSPQIDPQSIQVSGKGDFIIMGVKHQINYIDQQNSKEADILNDTIEKLLLQIRLLESYREVFSREEEMILANKSIRGDQNGLTAEALEEMADFYRERLTEIKEEQLHNEVALNKTRIQLAQFQNQLNEINKTRNQPTSRIIVTLSAKAATSASLTVTYIVNNAGWYPLYDVRVGDTKNPIQLYYKAQVFQNTGEDWNNVKITLSTSNPALGGDKPELSAWYLNIYEAVAQSYKNKKAEANYMNYAAPSSGAADRSVYEGEEQDALSISNYTQVVETSLSAEFQIAMPYTIESGGSGQLVDIQLHNLPATFRYYAVPKIDKTAFLTAVIADWEGLNLISGKANIYFEGTYVGETFFDLQNIKQNLTLSLGRDPKVVVKREVLTDYTSKNFIGTNRKEDYAWKIDIRNTKKDPIEIIIQDQYPVSQNSAIEVELAEGSGADINKDYGQLSWKLNINPAETKSVQFRYTVKYPKDKNVSGL